MCLKLKGQGESWGREGSHSAVSLQLAVSVSLEIGQGRPISRQKMIRVTYRVDTLEFPGAGLVFRLQPNPSSNITFDPKKLSFPSFFFFFLQLKNRVKQQIFKFLCKTAGQFFKALSVQTHLLANGCLMVPSLFSHRVFVTFRQIKNNALFLKAYKQTVYLFGVRPRQYNTLKGSKKVRSSQHLGKKWRTKQFFLGFFTTNC